MASVSQSKWQRKDGTSGTAWRVQFYVDGKKRSRLFDRKGDASRFVETIESKKRDGILGVIRPDKKRTFRDAVDGYLEACAIGLNNASPLEPQTITAYRQRLNRVTALIGSRPLVSINPDVAQETLTMLLASKRDRGSVRVDLRLFGVVMAFAVSKKWLGANPVAEIRLGRSWKHEGRHSDDNEDIGVIYSTAEMNAITATARTMADKDARWSRFAMMFAVMAFAGLRMGEIRGLPRSAINVHNGTIRIRQSATTHEGRIGRPKTKASMREVLIPDDVMAELWGWLELSAEGAKPTDLVFSTSSGKALSHQNIAKRWTTLTETAKVRRLRLHSLRHYYASTLLSQGASMLEVSEILGHEDSATTSKIYAHLVDDGLRTERRRALAENVRKLVTSEMASSGGEDAITRKLFPDWNGKPTGSKGDVKSVSLKKNLAASQGDND